MNTQPHYKAPKKDINPDELNLAMKNAEKKHQEHLQEIASKAHVDLGWVHEMKAKKDSELKAKESEIQSQLEQASQKRDHVLQEKLQFAHKDVERVQEVHSKVKGTKNQ